MAVPTTTPSLHQHSDSSKKCTPETCCSPSKIWRAIQTAIATDDRKGLATCFQDTNRIPHIKTVLLKERNINDATALPPSHKHRVLQFDKTIRREAASKFGKSVVDLNALQVALFYQRQDIACQLLQFLRQHASPTEMQSFLGHVWGKGNSSLHLACFHGMPRLVNLLLELGADPHATNACHFKPADCCKDPGCLAALEKATATTALDDEDAAAAAAAAEHDPAPVAPPARRHSATALVTPALKSSAASVSLKRQASLPGLNTRASVEKKARPGTPTTPKTRLMAAAHHHHQQQQPLKEVPKTSSVLALLHDKKPSQQQKQQHRDRQLPTPVMRSSFALRPTPETERPVSPPPTGEEDHPAAHHQQQQHQPSAPTVTADSVNTRHPPERSHHPQLAEPVGLAESASPPPPLSLPPSLTPSTTRSSDNDVTSDATSPPPFTLDGGGGTTCLSSSSSPATAAVVVETMVPDKQGNLQLPSSSSSPPPPAIIGTCLGVSISTTITEPHPHQQQEQQQQQQQQRAKHKESKTIPPATATSQASVRIKTTDDASTRLNGPDDPTTLLARLEDLTITCAVQHLANVFNFTTKGIYQELHFNEEEERAGATGRHQPYCKHPSNRALRCRATYHDPSLTGDSQVIAEQQPRPCVAVL